jgi:prepilin peptidase CpaA
MRSEEMGISNLLPKCIGFTAMFFAVFLLWREMDSFPIFLASLFLFTICLTDTLWTKIPNLINLTLILAALGHQLHTAGAVGFLHVLAGLFVGMALLIVPYLLGGMGAGDVKAMAALGALTGATAIFHIFLYVSLIGGLFAALFYLCSGRALKTIRNGWKDLRLFLYTRDFQLLRPTPTNMKFPYAAAIAFGYFAYVQFGTII